MVNLVALINKFFPDKKVSILDIGCGSGCIGISLKKMINCEVFALDISNFALNLTKQNNSDKDDVIESIKLMNVLLGNAEEDKPFVDLLSGGLFYKFYKPGVEKSTGFNIKLKGKNDDEILEGIKEVSCYQIGIDYFYSIFRRPNYI